MSRLLARARKNKGASSVEYIIVLVLVALTGVAVFKVFGGTIKTKMTDANTTMVNDVVPQK
jgi:Flp pilus assembly pilin Flp